MSKRSMDFAKMKIPNVVPNVVPVAEVKSTVLSNVAKWVPLICAGAAVGVSIIALKEIHNMRKEMAKPVPTGTDQQLKAKIENMEIQLNKISEFLKTKTEVKLPVKLPVKIPVKLPVEKKSLDEVIKNAVESQTGINLINEKFDTDLYEEVEVTDSESEES